MHLINFVHDIPITIEALGNKYSATVADTSKLNIATKGEGVFVFQYGPTRSEMVSNWTSRFVMNDEILVDTLNTRSSDGIGKVDLPEPDPCSGFVSSNMEGFIVGPTILLKFRDRRDIAMMLLTGRKGKPRIELAKTALSISGSKIEAQVFLTVTEGVDCSGTISGNGFKNARYILTRRPNSRVVKQQYSETLAEKNGPGTLSASWRPVSRAFDDTLAVFRPGEIRSPDLERILQLIGASEDAFLGQKNSSFIIGDGGGTSYTLSLVLERSLGRDMMDETVITLS